MLPHWIYIFISIITTLTISVILIKKNLFRRPVSIFMVLFIIGQGIGYGMNIDFLKVNIPHGDNGTSYSIASTAFPLGLAIMIDYVNRVFQSPHN